MSHVLATVPLFQVVIGLLDFVGASFLPAFAMSCYDFLFCFFSIFLPVMSLGNAASKSKVPV